MVLNNRIKETVLRAGFRALLSAGILWLAVSLMDWKKIGLFLTSFSLSRFAGIVILCLMHFVAMAVRWHLLINAHIDRKISHHILTYFRANLFNTVTPGNLGGDVYRFVSLKNLADSKTTLAAILFQERLVGLISMLFLFAGCYAWMFIHSRSFLTMIFFPFHAVMILCLMFGIGLFFVRPIIERLRKWAWFITSAARSSILNLLFNSLDFKTFHRFWVLIFYSAVAIGLWAFAVTVVSESMALRFWLPHLVAIIIAVELVRFIPVGIQGIGVRESTFAFLASSLGYDSETSFAVAIVSYTALSIGLLLIGLAGWIFTRSPKA
jgi:uncharacterized membrane protein YbhN (UPF0104 family)